MKIGSIRSARLSTKSLVCRFSNSSRTCESRFTCPQSNFFSPLIVLPGCVCVIRSPSLSPEFANLLGYSGISLANCFRLSHAHSMSSMAHFHGCAPAHRMGGAGVCAFIVICQLDSFTPYRKGAKQTLLFQFWGLNGLLIIVLDLAAHCDYEKSLYCLQPNSILQCRDFRVNFE